MKDIKTLMLYERDEKGQLIPLERELCVEAEDLELYPELKGIKIAVTPMTRGEIKKLFGMGVVSGDETPETTKDDDGELILKHCKSPAFSEEDIPFIKPVFSKAIVRTIFTESGIQLTNKKKSISNTDEFGKNS